VTLTVAGTLMMVLPDVVFLLNTPRVVDLVRRTDLVWVVSFSTMVADVAPSVPVLWNVRVVLLVNLMSLVGLTL
jgi:hypothetical protein